MKTAERAYTVFPSVHRFTGEWALTRACEWARKIKAASPEVNVRIVNENGVDLGVVS